MAKESKMNISYDLHGDITYHEKARQALPILVQQAYARNPITYSELAFCLNMPNPRNLNHPLGSIGKSIEELGKNIELEIPPIQYLVINKNDHLPGEGIGWGLRDFLKKPYDDMSNLEKEKVVNIIHKTIYDFRYWPRVLLSLGLKQKNTVLTDFIDTDIVSKNKGGSGGSGGEGSAHKALKKFVCNNPELLKWNKIDKGKIEVGLPSGDSLDVSFHEKKAWYAVEIKSKISDDNDLIRGFFQCIKYKAVMEAKLGVDELNKDVKVVLVYEGQMPFKLVRLSQMLGVEYFEVVAAGKKYKLKSN